MRTVFLNYLDCAIVMPASALVDAGRFRRKVSNLPYASVECDKIRPVGVANTFMHREGISPQEEEKGQAALLKLPGEIAYGIGTAADASFELPLSTPVAFTARTT